MKRCSIIIHSIGGNIYIIADYLREKLLELEIDARIYRVEDPDLHIQANKSDAANQYYEDIIELSIAKPETLEKSDMIILGSPSTFGNMSPEMKEFLESTYELFDSQKLEGKFFGCFTSCQDSICEGAKTLDTLIYWAKYLSLLHIPFGVNRDLKIANHPVTGIVHLEGKENLIRPSEKIGDAIELYANKIAKHLK